MSELERLIPPSASSQGSDAWYDPENGHVQIINESGITDREVFGALAVQHPEMAALTRWVNNTKGRTANSSLVERDRYVIPDNIYETFKTAYRAAQEDDVVAGVVEMTEALSLGWLDFDAEKEDESDIFMQIAEDTNLDDRIHEMWRDNMIISQFYVAVLWGQKEYRVRGRTKGGNQKRKTYNVNCPIGISLLDPLKVIPSGNFMFGQERLLYMADRIEGEDIRRVLADDNTTDLTVQQFIVAPYEPDQREAMRFAELGVDPSNLFILSPNVWRGSETRPAYERFAYPRMKSIFEILDLKHQLRASDRAHLIGGTNFIVLIKKGTDQHPAKPAELANLQGGVRTLGRVPVLVGDHRLSVEIVTPKLDMTLKPERYNTLDARLTARLMGLFETGNYSTGASRDDSIKLAKMASRVLESRRDKLIKIVHRRIIQETLDRSPELESEFVKLRYSPKRIALDLDPVLFSMIQDTRDRGDLSRESILDELGYDQADEARRRKSEKEAGYDKVFEPTNVPFDKPGAGPGQQGDEPPAPAPGSNPAGAGPKAAGRTQGGNRNGGGANPGAGKPSPKRPRTDGEPRS